MIDIKNYERLSISKGEIKFYDGAYNKCSNQNVPEIREKINNGTLVCDIEEYQSCSYSTKELKDMYSRLAELEDLIEKGKLVAKIDTKTEMTKEKQDKLEQLDKLRTELINKVNPVILSYNDYVQRVFETIDQQIKELKF